MTMTKKQKAALLAEICEEDEIDLQCLGEGRSGRQHWQELRLRDKCLSIIYTEAEFCNVLVEACSPDMSEAELEAAVREISDYFTGDDQAPRIPRPKMRGALFEEWNL